MTQISPDPNQDRRRRWGLTMDELIALFVTFTTLGSVLFWGFTRSGSDGLGHAGLTSLGDNRLGRTVGAAAQRFGLATAPAESGLAAPAAPQRPDATSGAAPAAGSSVPPPVTPAASLPTDTAPPAATSPALSGPAPGRAAPPAAPESSSMPTAAPSPPAAPPAGLPTLAPTRAVVNFQDVPANYWARAYIDALSSRGLVDGFSDNTFKPDAPVTRAQLARLIDQALVLSPTGEAVAFSDVAGDYWAAPAIDEAVRGGFLKGFPDNRFQPEQPVTRLQVLTALVTGLKTQAKGDPQTVVLRYADAAQIPDWAVDKMAAATQASLVVIHPDISLLRPSQPATRAEVSAMIYQALVSQGRLQPIESEYQVQP